MASVKVSRNQNAFSSAYPDLCRFDNCEVLWDARELKYYHPSVVVSMVCPNPEPLKDAEHRERDIQ